MGDVPIPEFIDNLSDKQLRTELGKVGVNAGPITPTTRRLFKNKLAKKLAVVAAFQSGVKDEKSSKQETQESPVVTATEKLQKAVKLQEKVKKGDAKLYYGVFLPITDSKDKNAEPIVFESKSATLLAIKEHKTARFKAFENFEQAKEYSLKGNEENGRLMSKVRTSNSIEDIGSKFPSLRQEDLNMLLRHIENGELEESRRLIWSNPRYLISSADGPVVLKASARYNALHIAAKSNKPEICEEILSILENPGFHEMVFPNTTDENMNMQRINHLLDSYLNTPEKILFETPLHFACKLGFKDVVDVLVSHSQCSADVRNKFNQRPCDVICARASTEMKHYKNDIRLLLGDQYYVPLLRYHDNTEHAIVGTPITLKQKLEDYDSISSASHSSDFISPLRPSLAISALAGPMPKEHAMKFQKFWTTPSKRKDFGKAVRYIRRTDSEKGDEQIGRQLAEKEDVGWVEYWDFLNDFANFASEDGLTKLDEYLKQRMPWLSVTTAPHMSDSFSRDMSELTNMLQNVHLKESQSGNTSRSNSRSEIVESKLSQNNLILSSNQHEDSTRVSNSSVSTNSTDNSSNYETPPENLIQEQFVTPESKYSDSEGKENHPGHGGDKKNDSLVKKLFSAENVNNIDNFADDFSKNLTLNEKNGQGVVNSPEVNWFSNKNCLTELRSSKQYRSVGDNDSDVFSSPSGSDVSGCSSATDHMSNAPKGTVFLAGSAPTKIDCDVLTAIGDTDLNMSKYPAILQWKLSVLSFSENERMKWSTPRKERIFSFTPDRVSSTPNRTSSQSVLTPSSGRLNSFFTPDKNMRRYLYRSFMPSHKVE